MVIFKEFGPFPSNEKKMLNALRQEHLKKSNAILESCFLLVMKNRGEPEWIQGFGHGLCNPRQEILLCESGIVSG